LSLALAKNKPKKKKTFLLQVKQAAGGGGGGGGGGVGSQTPVIVRNRVESSICLCFAPVSDLAFFEQTPRLSLGICLRH